MNVVFYETASGRRPVSEALEKLDVPNQSKVGSFLLMLQNQGSEMKEPHVKSLGGGLKELRISIHPGQYRVVYFFEDQESAVLLHSFKKKTQKTPKKDLDLARKRMREWQGRRTK